MNAVVLAVIAALGTALLMHVWLRPQHAVAAAGMRSLGQRLDDRLAQAGLGGIPVGVTMGIATVMAIASGALGFAATGVPVIGVLAAVAAVWGAISLVISRIRRRRRLHRGSWPDVVDHLIASIRSGMALPEAVEHLTRTGPEGLREAFDVYARTYRATGSFNTGIAEVKERLADPTADRILETLRMAREVGGGELVSVLRSLAVYLREEQAVRHEVEARQSWVMNAARLGVAAPWVVLLMLASRPEAAAAYRTPMGTVVILGGLGVTIVAYRIMVTLGRLRDEGRWFA